MIHIFVIWVIYICYTYSPSFEGLTNLSVLAVKHMKATK